MNVTIVRPSYNNSETDNRDVFTCQSTGQPSADTHWAIIIDDRGGTAVRSVGNGSRLTVDQLCRLIVSSDLSESDDVSRSVSLTLRCTATRLNFTAYSDVDVNLSDSRQHNNTCRVGMWPHYAYVSVYTE